MNLVHGSSHVTAFSPFLSIVAEFTIYIFLLRYLVFYCGFLFYKSQGRRREKKERPMDNYRNGHIKKDRHIRTDKDIYRARHQ